MRPPSPPWRGEAPGYASPPPARHPSPVPGRGSPPPPVHRPVSPLLHAHDMRARSPSPVGAAPAEVGRWSSSHVVSWLERLGLGAYRKQFIHHAVSGAILLALTDEQLKSELGMLTLGHRITLRAAITQLRDAGASSFFTDDTPVRQRSPSPAREQRELHLRQARAEHDAEKALRRAERIALRAQELAEAAEQAAAMAEAARRKAEGTRPRVRSPSPARPSPVPGPIAERMAAAKSAHESRVIAGAAQRTMTKWAAAGPRETASARADAYLAGALAHVLGVHPSQVDVSPAGVAAFLNSPHAAELGLPAAPRRAAGDDARKAWLVSMLRRRSFDMRLQAEDARRRERKEQAATPRAGRPVQGQGPSFDAFLQRQWAALPPTNTLSRNIATAPTASTRTRDKVERSAAVASHKPRAARPPPKLVLLAPARRSSETALVAEFDGDAEAAALAAEMRARASKLQVETQALRTRLEASM